MTSDDSITSCVLDANGAIHSVNRAWRRFADLNGLRLPKYGVGASYLLPSRGNPTVYDGLQEVLSGREEHFLRCDRMPVSGGVPRLFSVSGARMCSGQIELMHIDLAAAIADDNRKLPAALAELLTGSPRTSEIERRLGRDFDEAMHRILSIMKRQKQGPRKI